MARQFLPKVITANDLFEGDVVYLTKQGQWTRDLTTAQIAHTPEQVQTMLDVAKAMANQIVGAYGANVEIGADGKPSPAHFREDFRTRGPSNYFHGKQADGASSTQQQAA